MPIGTPVLIDPDTRALGDSALFGGSPARVMRLSAAGRRAYDELRAGTVRTAAGARLAGTLTDAGLAVCAPEPTTAASVTVVVPVRDRTTELARLLRALGRAHPVIVVDDGSRRPAAVADVCRRAGARLIVRERTGGPAAARNSALAGIRSELIAFCDSDCCPPAGWIDALAGHLADPAVAAVAPRVTGRDGRRSPLDLGDRAGPVQPMTRVSYLPTAALLVRRTAIAGGFDEQLRFGEDVDLVWRLIEAGWRCRYDPRVVVEHEEPDRLGTALRRRFDYGTSAAPLGRRHPGRLAPLVLYPWPALGALGLLTRRPALAAAAWTLGAAQIVRRLRRAGVPAHGVARACAVGIGQTTLGVCRWAVQFGWPVVLAGLASRRTRPVCLGLAVVAAGDAVRAGGTESLGRMAYATGVWSGAMRARDLQAVRPAFRRGSGLITRPD